MFIAHGLDTHHVLLCPVSMVHSGLGGGRSQIHPSLPLKGPWIFLEELLPWEHLELSNTKTVGLSSAASALKYRRAVAPGMAHSKELCKRHDPLLPLSAPEVGTKALEGQQ